MTVCAFEEPQHTDSQATAQHAQSTVNVVHGAAHLCAVGQFWRCDDELCQSCALADVPLPEGLVAPTEENDELRAEADADTGKPEKWTETGLHTAQ
jgi:hypothetical protein